MKRKTRPHPKLGRPIIVAFAKNISRKIQKISSNPGETQQAMLNYLITRAGETRFGLDHDFRLIKGYNDFKARVPLRDYEGLKPYITKIISGQDNILWPGKPVCFAYTSGTTSGTKYIPISKEFIPLYQRSGRNVLLNYIAETGNSACVGGKTLYCTHDIELDSLNGLPVRTIAGIMQSNIPFQRFFRKRFVPSEVTNRMEDFQQKIELTIDEVINQNITTVGGLPSWHQHLFNRIQERTGSLIKDVFPNLSLRIHGGVNDRPYRPALEKAIGKKLDTVEAFPASEGFIGFQDKQQNPALLLNLQGGIFFEFIPADEEKSTSPRRYSLTEVELGVNYNVILNTVSGLWGYRLGDTVKFVSRNPYRFFMTGRSTHFLSTSGEHLIAEDVDGALSDACKGTDIVVSEYHVGPKIDSDSGLPGHEWFIEFEKEPSDYALFSNNLNELISSRSITYHEFTEAKIILPLQVNSVRKGGFTEYMQSIGKLGWEKKVPRLSNDRSVADALMKYVVP